MIEALGFSEIFVSTYQTVLCSILEDGRLHPHCCENQKYDLSENAFVIQLRLISILFTFQGIKDQDLYMF
jgi:hypothetical protein